MEKQTLKDKLILAIEHTQGFGIVWIMVLLDLCLQDVPVECRQYFLCKCKIHFNPR
jgi:hypothetical protein